MQLPSWIPQVGKPWNPAFHEAWEEMTPNEKRWSFLFDVFACLAFFAIAWAMFS
jgi:hypothetical protein